MRPQSTTVRRPLRGFLRPFLGCVCLATALLGFGPGRARGEGPGTEYAVKAAFFYNFTKFVEWPQGNPGRTGPFVIAVIGADPFGPVLDSLEGKTAQGRRVSVRRLPESNNLESCEILFGPASEAERMTRILNAAQRRDILTVSDAPDFAKKGGMIELVKAGDKVRFRINAPAAERVGLRISSHLLNLAIREGENP